MSQRESIRQQLLVIVENETGQVPPPLEDHMKIREELGLDSVDIVSLVMQIEGHYRIRLAQAELMQSQTVGELLSLVESKLQSPNQQDKQAA